ncbi:MAG: hypothetical protein WA916_08820 [Arcobacter sp.]|uniref:hypothetical protein n=1 Tax=Arcobacter sp. TaxID=1872629 RepID=UPI003C718973
MFPINYIFHTEGIEVGDSYEIKLDFEKDDDAINVFKTLLEIQEGLENFNKAITNSISDEIKVSSILLDIEKGSIKTKLHDLVKKLPDDNKIGFYVDKPKEVLKDVLKSSRKILFDITKDTTLNQLEKENKLFDKTKEILNESSISNFGYKVSKEKLLKAADSFYKPIRESANDIFIKTENEFEIIDKTFQVTLENTFKETTNTNIFDATLFIKKPVYIGTSKWDLVLDKSIEAEMLDENFIAQIKNREVPIFAGDKLYCKFKSVITLNDDYETIDTKYYILEVYKVLVPEDEQYQDTIKL